MYNIFIYWYVKSLSEVFVLEMTYLDNSATTAVCQAAADKALYMMTTCFGNPSSLHRLGFEAEREIESARESVAKLLGVPAADLLFTSGGTEANNLAIFGATAALARRGKHIVTTAVEHSSVAAACERLEKQGYTVSRLYPDANGMITPAAIADACRPDTVLVSIMLVNNETGAHFSPERAVSLIRRRSPFAFIHCDAVQAAGKIPIFGERWQVDALSVSAHKLHGPKGCGALYLRHGARILPQHFGGKQERGIRPGTEAAPLIAAFGAAVDALPPMAQQRTLFTQLREHLLSRLEGRPEIVFHLPADGVPYIIHLSVPGLKSETVLHFLSERNIFVSSGSACAKGAKSPVLAAMKLPDVEIDSAIPVSLSYQNTVPDIDRFADALEEAICTLVRKENSERSRFHEKRPANAGF